MTKEKVADEMYRQLNFARDRAQNMRQAAVGHFSNGDIAKAYQSLGGAMAIEDMVTQFNALRLRIADGEYDG